MANRKRYYVNPHPDGWEVKREGAQRASRVTRTKAEAMDAGRELARGREPSQLRVRRRDGSFETEHTYGSDPYPPRG